jgi:hypothetical protein
MMASSAKFQFSGEHTVYEAVKRFVELRGAVSKKTVKAFAAYCSDQKDSEYLMSMYNSKDLMDE